jgi:hypothetical protein
MVDVQALAADVLRASGLRFRRVSVVELNRSTPRSLHLGLLLFIDGAARPSVMVRVARDAIVTAQLEAEFSNLERLHAAGSDELTTGLPRPLHLQRSGGWTVLAETALPGRRMKNLPPYRYFRSRRFPRDLDRTEGWLAELQRLSGEFSVGAQPIAEAVTAYREGFDVSADLQRLLDDTVRRLESVAVPMAPWHGDFCSANLLIDESGQLGVTDWEDPLTCSWPLSDLLHHLTSLWCSPYEKGRAALTRNYRRMFFERHARSELVRRLVDRSLDRMSIDPRLRLPLATACWVAYANRKREQLSSIDRGPRASDKHLPLTILEGGRCLNLELLAEHRERFLTAG